jgi:hypothetical protein
VEEKRASVIRREVSTGDTVVFDKRSRDLFILDADAAGDLPDDDEGALEVALKRAREGRGRHFDRTELERVHVAFGEVLLLV